MTSKPTKSPRVLVVDVGGSNVKCLATGYHKPVKFISGPDMTPGQMMKRILKLTAKWRYAAVSMGYPGVVRNGRIAHDPHNLGPGWVGFGFKKAFGCPVKMINDAAMQALGSYQGGTMLFLGLGTGLGSAMIIDGSVAALELGHLPYGDKSTYESVLGAAGRKRLGNKRWRKHVMDVVQSFRKAVLPDDIVLGGGNARYVKHLPAQTRLGDNSNAFMGGFRLWETGRSPH